VIGKVLRGRNARRLLQYLYGPGQANEHTDPHLVAGFGDPAELEPERRPDGTRDFRRLAGYAHASTRMRDDLKTALQARWEDSLRCRATISPHSPVPLLDELLAPFRSRTRQPTRAPRATRQQTPAPEAREKKISQIPPKQPEGPTPALRGEPVLHAADLVRHQELGSQVFTFGR
jgi:hypothetical protein